MSELKQKGKKQKLTLYIFYVMLVAILLFMFGGEMLLPKENDAFLNETRSLDVIWYQIMPDGAKRELVNSEWCDVKKGETAVIEAVLPEDIKAREYLCFRSSQQDMDIYIDGELRGKYSTRDTRPFGKNSASAYVFVQVGSEDGGKVIRLETTSLSKYSGLVNQVLIGERMSIWGEFIRAYGGELALAFVLVILGILTVIVSTILHLFYDKEIMLEYLGWGIILVAIWIISESRLRQLLFANGTVIASMAFLSLLVIPMPFLIYMNSIQKKRYNRVYTLAMGATVLNFVVTILLQIFNVVDFIDIMLVSHGIIGGSILLIYITLWRDWRRGYLKEYKMIAIGLGCLTITALIELAKTYFAFYLVTGAVLSVGLAFLLVLACIHTGKFIVAKENAKQKFLLSKLTQIGFLAHMSHEIRTPLNTVLGMNEMILREETNEVTKRYASQVKEAGKTLEAMINDVIDFSKMQGTGYDIEVCSYYVASFVNDSIHLLKAGAETKNLEVQYRIDKDIPSILEGDEIRIKRILNILMENAIRHTSHGRVVLSIQGEVNDQGLFVLKLAVSDTGSGMKQELLDRLFRTDVSFRDGEEAEISSSKLTLVKRFVDQMGGTIKVSSVLGEGSLFSVRIPQKIINREPIGDIQTQYNREMESEYTVRERLYAPDALVLVVDDNQTNLDVVRNFLRRSAIQLDFAASGMESVEMCRAKKYDLILMDHMMPEMDGIEALHVIHSDTEGLNRDTEVLALTANVVSGIREKYIQEGFCEYLPKPIDAIKLERMLYKFLKEKATFLFEEPAARQPDILFAKEKAGQTEEEVAPVEEGAEEKEAVLIDKATGMGYCANNKEVYEEVLKSYYGQSDGYKKILKESFEAKDWQVYGVKAHGLKSSSLTIGAKELSELAKTHEFAAKEENEDIIRESYPQLMQMYEAVLNELERQYGFQAKPAVQLTEEAEECITADEYQNFLKELLSSIQGFAMNEIIENAERMYNTAVEGDTEEIRSRRKECMTQICEAVNEFDYDRAEELLNSLNS